VAAITKSKAIARIQRGLGFRTDLEDDILLELRQAQTMLEQGQSLPWWLRIDSSLSATANVSTITIPTGFIRFDEDVEPWVIDTTTGKRNVVKVMDYDQLLSLSWDEDTSAVATGTITGLAIRQSTFIVAPTPTEATTVYAAWYFADDDLESLDDDDSNLWLTYAPLVIVGMAGVAMAKDIKDQDATQTFTQMYDNANTRLVYDIELRKSRTYQVGGES
jgi:hypothetical protein